MASGPITALDWLHRRQDLILPLAIIASVLVILVPLPPAALLDVLLSANIAVAVMVLLTTIYVRTPLEFSIFPTMLLATTLARLGAQRRHDAADPHARRHARQDAAGRRDHGVCRLRRAASSIVVGIIIFVIIIVIQFVVITKGATRISEVGGPLRLGRHARQADGHRRRPERRHRSTKKRPNAAAKKSPQQADFYGAMDGASKFVRGDAIAGILITRDQHRGRVRSSASLQVRHAASAEAATSSHRLTIGDGLVSQVPAFLISLAAGLLVTRSTQKSNLAERVHAAALLAAASCWP